MPLYSFKCKVCGSEFEEKQSLEEFDQGKLPERKCGEDKKCEVERTISPLKSISSTWAYWRR